ncbi:MAG: MaoC family dehydratase [Dehalococcoidia bacterium]
MTENIQGLVVGSSAEFSKQITPENIATFAEITGDTQPLHTDPTFGVKTRFKKPIAHGMIGAGIISAAIGVNLAPGKVVVYLGQNMQFRAPVYPGDTITAVVEVTELDIERNRVSLSTKVNNQEGTEVIRGDALVMVEELQEDS